MHLMQSRIIQPSTLALYKFENNGDDSSANGYNLATQGTVPYTSDYKCPINSDVSAGQFTATNYFLGPANLNTRLTGMSVYTIEFYLYLTSYAGNPTIVQFVNSLGNNQIQVRAGTTKGTIRWWANNVETNTAEIFVLNQWNHIAVTSNGTQRTLYYNNNIALGPGTLAGAFGTVTSVRIGNPTWFGEYVTGYLDNFRISNVCRTSFPTLD